MTAELLELQHLRVDIEAPQGEVAILRELDLTLAPGERLGIVGESGSGKSMTALAIIGLLPDGARVTGALRFSGEDLLDAGEDRLCALRGRRIAMIFQEPMTALNPVQPIGDQVAEGPRLHLGLGRQAAMEHAKHLLTRVGLPPERFSPRLYPHQLSGGQRQRVMIAIALASEPDLLIADEPTTALDVTIQTDILDLIVDLARERNMGLIMISHDLGVIARTTERMAVMYAGRIVEIGRTAHLLSALAHPYSRGLYRAMPQHAERSDRPAKARPRLPTIPGTVPDPRSPITGCAFSSRCRHVEPDCRTTVPFLAGIGPTHFVACHHPQGQDHRLESVR
ncbi:MAG: ABC transporter ATP-binding protein [Alphaproteobacteria bacterium]|nr:ABC transporter ATP-binding protein [Alphaproteobacteria bacterium]